jgi:hypothetical protein
MSLPVPLSLPTRGAPHGGHCPGKFVKNQYQFVSDFSFLTASCRKDTVRVKDRCNQVTLGRRTYGGASGHRPPTPGVRPNPTTSGQPKSRWRKAESNRRPMLGPPLGSGSAHVVEFRPVGVDQRSGENTEHAGKVGQCAPGPAAVGSIGRAHDFVRATVACGPFSCW